VALSFCDSEEKSFLSDINRLIAKAIPIVKEHPFAVEQVEVVERVWFQNRRRR
jgi:ATP-dependent RNA helicase RhlE